jgi:hypothetical protein
MRRLTAVIAAIIVGSAFIAAPAAAATGSAAAATRTITILQMNLCNSGKASCYADGRAIDEAKTMLYTLRPNVVFLNEVCRGDELEIGWEGNYNDYPATHFTATNQKCTNGADYGSAMLVDNSYAFVDSQGLYTAHDGTSERRAYGCSRFSGFFGCVTHLSTDEPIALKQCNELTKQRLPAFQSSLREPSVPAIVSGDLNMEYDTSDPENVQKCVPSGWTRKGDGDVQHVMVSSSFTNMTAKTYNMFDTDHDALQITVTAPW